jgi:hypothetical protein
VAINGQPVYGTTRLMRATGATRDERSLLSFGVGV